MIALVGGATIENAAHAAGISRRTAHRRLKEPRFQDRLRAIRGDMVQRAAGTLAAASSEAVKTLLTLQEDANPGSVRLGAARAILELGSKLRESTDLADRIAALEAQLSASAD